MALEADASGDDVARGRDAAGDGNVPGDSNIADDGDVSRDLRVSENFDAVLLDDEVDGAALRPDGVAVREAVAGAAGQDAADEYGVGGRVIALCVWLSLGAAAHGVVDVVVAEDHEADVSGLVSDLLGEASAPVAYDGDAEDWGLALVGALLEPLGDWLHIDGLLCAVVGRDLYDLGDVDSLCGLLLLLLLVSVLRRVHAGLTSISVFQSPLWLPLWVPRTIMNCPLRSLDWMRMMSAGPRW